MGKVVKLVPLNRRSVSGVQKTLKSMAAASKAESFTGIAIVAVDAQGYTHSAFESGENVATLVGGVERLKYRLLNHQGE